MPILDVSGNPIDTQQPKRERAREMLRERYWSSLKARYDAAQTSHENEKHWAMADGLSASAAGSPEVRKKLRDRSRYEVANDSYAAGIVQSKVVDVIGSGPRLSLSLEDETAAAEIAAKFHQWAKAIDLGGKLRTFYRSLIVDGEAFMLRVATDYYGPSVPQLDYVLYEADQVATPYGRLEGERYRDGVRLDDVGHPLAYDVLNYHPGDDGVFYGIGPRDYRTYPAKRRLIHLYRQDRPGQVRGIPHLTPALSLFAKRRRYALATITAAETAANLAAVLYTDHPALGDEDIAALDDDSFFEVPRGSMPVLPTGYKLNQLKSEQPTETYGAFSKEILQEISRCLGVPLAIAINNSENHNYASGRLDHQLYYRLVHVERCWLNCNVLDLVFKHWLEEALFIPGYLPPVAFADDEFNLPHRWYYDPKPHVDPEKEARGLITLWEKGLATDEDFFLETLGRDPVEMYAILARQKEAREKLGLPFPGQELQVQKEMAEANSERQAEEDPE